MSADDRQPLVFVHIPKTAGTTLHKILAQQFRPSRTLVTHDSRPAEIRADAERVKAGAAPRYDLVMGHLGLGIHELRPGARYLSCIRRPVPRLVSHYHYARDTPNHYLYEQIHAQKMDLVDYVSSGLSGEFVNGMTRTFAGVADFHGAVLGDADLERAKRNIEELFLFVGTTEQFDAGLLVLQRILGAKTPYYIRRKVGRYQGEKKKPSEAELAEVAKLNELDEELYRHVSGILGRRLEEFSIGEAEVEEFRRVNAARGKARYLVREAFSRCGLRSPF